MQRRRTQRRPLGCHLQEGQPATPEASGSLCLSYEFPLSLALFTFPCLPEPRELGLQGTRQQQPDAEPDCEGVVSLCCPELSPEHRSER